MSNLLRQLDLNLLLTLDALLIEQQVTRAAQRLHLAQPTVSLQLARLREFFDDPLLLPGPRGMQPTARAEALREPLRQALAGLEQAIAPCSPFDPSRSSQTWRIAAFDYSELTVLLPTLAGLRRTAPGTRLSISQIAPGLIGKKAQQGDIDLAFLTSHEAPSNLRQRLLFHENYVLAGRAGHPRLQRAPSLQEFCELEHAIVSPDGGGFQAATDLALADLGVSRRVVLSLPHFALLGALLASSDLVAMLPARLARNNKALQVSEAPIAVPGFDLLMLWPERMHLDPGHRWLRQQIVDAL